MNALSTIIPNLERLPSGIIPRLDRESSFLEIDNEDNLTESVDKHLLDPVEHIQKTLISIIDENTLTRSCLTRCLSASEADFMATGYSSVEEWRQSESRATAPIVLLCANGRKSTEMVVRRDLELVVQAVPEARVIVVSDLIDSAEIVGALERGARGYISMSSNLDVALAAIRLVRAGGTFIPASGLMSSRSAVETKKSSEQGLSIFTEKQIEVIERLRKGESNKIIAYQLNMGESTVKVHVRNVMRKIKARSRTEIAFLTNELFQDAT